MSIEHRVFKKEFAGRTVEVEVGKFANLANGSAMVKYGDTSVLSAVTDSGPKNIGFFPLSVEYEEKMYAAGKIPGGYLKREGRPTEKATLAARLIDRPIRPMFPEGFMHDLQIINTVMSLDQNNSPEISAMLGASIALSISDIPFKQPIAGVIVGYVDGEFILNPDVEESKKSTLDLTVAGTKDAVVMVEAGADMVPEEVILEGILFGHEEIKKMVEFIEEIVDEVGLEKEEFSVDIDQEFYDQVKEELYDDIDKAMRISDKHERNVFLDEILANKKEDYVEAFDEDDEHFDLIKDAHKDLQKEIVRKMIAKEKIRPDGRDFDEIRALESEVKVLPKVHGTGLFRRGLTQALSVTTLGALGEGKRLDGLEKEDQKRYMHHYNFPPYSVGETGRIRVNRRAIGHGALGERALLPVLPTEEEFPYSIRVVSEVLTCNGSSSQASICGSTLSLLDAGVPIKDSVAGIAMGLIKEGDDVTILTDIQGVEDFYGDMDFKVAGTRDGITALQMDIKMEGLSKEILKEALAKGKKARNAILDNMDAAISEPRPELSPYAPRVISLKIDPEKIGDIIGPGGKTITKITQENNVKIDIDDDGTVLITAEDGVGGANAKEAIEQIVKEVEVGKIYTGTIKKIVNFGAFVEVLPGKDGLCHISQFTEERLGKVSDKFEVGDKIPVKVKKIDDRGRIDLSRKDALKELNKEDK